MIAGVRTGDFDYDLPGELIAQQAAPRGTSRLLVVERTSGRVSHRTVADLPELLDSGDLLLLNDTRVLPSRVQAVRPTGRRFELLLLRPETGWASWEALLRPSSRARPGERLVIGDGGVVTPLEPLGDGRWRIAFEPPLDAARLERLGEAPLPPYIRRPDGATALDRERYQTVYAERLGSAAAPTAGLHFTDELLDRIRAAGVETAFVTLHVGLGTFRPVTVDRVEDHRMHAEWYRIPEATAAAVATARRDGRRIVCVGTTVVRTLEGAMSSEGELHAGEGWTDLFITPGFRFQAVGAMLTNFHLPKSTLLMLVSAFAGRERVLAAYREAIAERYRFFSYGDAMLIL
jgi:S-adenosylmethionine:tRNA ribosyltransferase-isomerase